MLSHIHLTHFRSHKEMNLELSPQSNVILGANGAGKTNILEAVLVLSLGKSYRAHDTDLLQYSSSFAKVEGVIDESRRTVKLQKDASGSLQKTFTINDKTIQRLSFTQTVPVVLFEPEFMQIIARGPDMRRDYFDGILARIQPDYQTLLNRYKRVLAQRNNLLKSPHATKDQFFVWDIKLSELGGYIVSRRTDLLKAMHQEISAIYGALAGKKHAISVEYETKNSLTDYTNSFLKGLQKNTLIDRERGFTSLGPHRDDYSFFINNKATQVSASRGETRTLLLSLKIFEAGLIEHARGRRPILLLDDVFSELDETRQTHLVEFFKEHQVIITTTTVTPLIRGISGQIFEI